MSLYPLAINAREALAGADHAARTKAEARKFHISENHQINALETEWLTLTLAELADLAGQTEEGVATGFVQRYENADGATVLAVTYWKITSDNEPPEPAPIPTEPEPDHTDDLYFRQGRTKPKRKSRKKHDPNQMDLFGKPEE